MIGPISPALNETREEPWVGASMCVANGCYDSEHFSWDGREHTMSWRS